MNRGKDRVCLNEKTYVQSGPLMGRVGQSAMQIRTTMCVFQVEIAIQSQLSGINQSFFTTGGYWCYTMGASA